MTRIRQGILISALYAIAAVSAASADDHRSEYEAWLQQTQSEFRDYLDKNDKEFLGFLNKRWESVEVSKPETRDPEPKPENIPVAPSVPEPTETDQPDATIKPVKKPVAETKLEPVIPPIRKPETVKKPEPRPDQNARTVTFEFFGEPVSVEYNRKFRQPLFGTVNNKHIAKVWKKLASVPHQEIVDQLSDYAKERQLNDWGNALLFDAFSRSLFADANSRNLVTWFLLVKAGFDARVAYNQQIFLLMPSRQELFGTTFFTLEGQRYYSVTLNEAPMKPGKVFTYGGKHKTGQRILDFSQPNRLLAGADSEKRELAFEYQSEKHIINVQYAPGLVKYLESFPQLQLTQYFEAGMPEDASYEIRKQLAPLLEGKSETEAINLLLRFVQTAFRYKTDEEQFHRENYLFPLETIHYPYSDCEDRAALFAWLVESLTDLDVIIVDYPGHVATAVAFSNPVSGDHWKFKGRNYTIADPTYVNASAGMTMPQYKNATPELKAF